MGVLRVLRIAGSPSDRLAVSALERFCDVSDSAAEVSLSVDVWVETLFLFGDGHSSVSELSELADGVSWGEGCVFCRF